VVALVAELERTAALLERVATQTKVRLAHKAQVVDNADGVVVDHIVVVGNSPDARPDLHRRLHRAAVGRAGGPPRRAGQPKTATSRRSVTQARMGHSSVAVTLDRYGHLFEGLDERIAAGLDAAGSQRLPTSSRNARATGTRLAVTVRACRGSSLWAP
jgi:hypothetical protein